MRSLSMEEIRQVAGGRAANGLMPTGIKPMSAPAGTVCINPTQAATVVSWAHYVGEGVGGVAGGALATYVTDGFAVTGPAAQTILAPAGIYGAELGSYAATQIAQSGITAYQQVVNTWTYAMSLYNVATNQPSAASWYNMSYTQACDDSGEYLFGT